MKPKLCLLFVVLALCFAPPAPAAVSMHFELQTLTPGTVSNIWTVDIDTDLASMALYVVLTQGTVYDPFAASLTLDGDALGVSLGDTYFTANGNSSTGIAGGAGDLGHVNPGNPGGEEVGPTVLGVSWFSPGSDIDDIGVGLPIGRFTFSDDAQGTWKITAGNDTERVIMEGVMEGGTMGIPEPASLVLLGLGGLAAPRRR